MKYFAIHFTLNEKIAGRIEQVKEYIFNCNVDSNSRFIDKFPFQKIDIEPILAIPILHPKAERTDFINVNGSIGFSFASIVISEKLKNIIENFNINGIDFYKTSIIYNTVEFSNYWQTHITHIPYEHIDFDKTTFNLKDRDNNRQVVNLEMKFDNTENFLDYVNKINYPRQLRFKDIFFKEGMNLDYFFMRYLEANSYGIVSERLKNEIEKNSITEIEFRPIEISLSEWIKRDGPRDQIYGRSW